ncbi:MAG TPA: hydroxymethylbilane synthase [Bryobacteraceae bacterium]|jgi:hydroxymethylbilane synthase|nr:hydroxymethylbilane synthase [Bryobacteraceae bacterium]
MIILGSRGSALALWQARHIVSRLAAMGVESRIEIIKTTGDKITGVPLAKAGGKGLFTKEIEEALIAGSIDAAVHSLKDLPSELPEGLTLSAIPEREDPRDALCGKPLAEGARVGTSSLRRAAQLHAMGRGLKVETLRGNVDTRLRKLDEGQYDSVVLAAAGLRRLGWRERITEMLPVEVMCPAAGQGALAIETRNDGGQAQHIVGNLDHPASRIAVTAERELLRTLGGGCQVPIGAYARVEGRVIHLRAIVASPDGAKMICGEQSGEDPQQTGVALARDLLARGAEKILSDVYAA